MAGSIESCANCGTAIGKLETPMLWNDEVVCSDCHAKLDRAHAIQLNRIDKVAEREKRDIPSPLVPRDIYEEQARQLGARDLYPVRTLPKVKKHYEVPKFLWWVLAIGIAGLILVGLGSLLSPNRFHPLYVVGGVPAVIAGVIWWIYLLVLPIIIADFRGHPAKTAIRICTFFSLLIPLLWIVALIWAFAGGHD